MRKHGLCESPEYKCWENMRSRCNNPNATGYQNWGGRGIKVCDRWDDFRLFLQDVGLRPSPEHSIDRFPNRDGDYEPGNVRWATRLEQNSNTRNALDIYGMTLGEVGRKTKKHPSVIRHRLDAGRILDAEKGFYCRGKFGSNAKLTDELVISMRSMHTGRGGWTEYKEIALKHGASTVNAYRVIKRLTWKNV